MRQVLPKDASSDPFYASKVSSIYEGTYLSKNDSIRRILRTLRAFEMLDQALATRQKQRLLIDSSASSLSSSSSSSSFPFLLGDSLTQGDICVYPRLCKVPQVCVCVCIYLFIYVCMLFSA